MDYTLHCQICDILEMEVVRCMERRPPVWVVNIRTKAGWFKETIPDAIKCQIDARLSSLDVTASDSALTEEQLDLQSDFEEVVAKMIQSGCPLPESFQLHYRVMMHPDNVISIRPFLTPTEAGADCSVLLDKTNAGVACTIIHGQNIVETANFESDPNRPRHAIDIVLGRE